MAALSISLDTYAAEFVAMLVLRIDTPRYS